MRYSVWQALVVVVAVGCGGGETESAPPSHPGSWIPRAEASGSAAAVAPEPPPAASLPRSAVREIVHEGLARFLQRVDLDVDHPVMKGGHFFGFRILALKGDPSFWQGVDLKPGDVVARVNGFGLANENEAHEAFSSLEVASELDVQYERNGQPRELRYAIVDDR
jgi:type II secretory pathway component PulC